MSQQPEVERRVVSFAGHVQGVGFRYTTRQIAADFQVLGFVQNLPDGRVQLVCEGTRAEVERFIARIGSQMQHYVRTAQVSIEPATGEFANFSIRR